ncbi:MAG: hypothetical protein AAFR17_12390 [Pseudomonadota bacterium]
MKRPSATVTDHAVIRYLEREWGVDIEAVRARLRRIAQTGVENEAAAVILNGTKYCLRGSTMTTVIRADGPRRRRRKGKSK